MTDYGDAKLPDPPAYDPRLERADAEEALAAKRSAELFDMAVNDRNGFVCALLVYEIQHDVSGQSFLEEICDAAAFRLQDHNWTRYFPQDVRDALGLDD